MTDSCYQLEIGQPHFPTPHSTFSSYVIGGKIKETSMHVELTFTLSQPKKWSLREGLLGTEVGGGGAEKK